MHIINVIIWNTNVHYTVKTPIYWTPPPWYPANYVYRHAILMNKFLHA